VVSVTSKSIDLTSYTKIRINYWVRRGSSNFSERPDSGEDLIVEYYNSSNSWIQLDKFWGNGTQAQIYQRSHDLSSGISHKNFKIRFRQTGGSGSDCDYFHIDDVEICSLIRYDHDIEVTSANIPAKGKMAIPIFIKPIITNQGKNNESNLTIQLKIDSVVKNSTKIATLNALNQTSVTLSWTPQKEKLFKVEIYAVPVANENITTNNQLYRMVNVTSEPNLWYTPTGYNLSVMTGKILKDNLTRAHFIVYQTTHEILKQNMISIIHIGQMVAMMRLMVMEILKCEWETFHQDILILPIKHIKPMVTITRSSLIGLTIIS
jgi:hypothetical protein